MSGIDMKQALDKAAASPDPVIRNISLEYMKAVNIAERLKPFIEVYVGGLDEIEMLPEQVLPPVRKLAAAPAPRLNGGQFAEQIVAILRDIGKPTQYRELYENYTERHGDGVKPETFRQKLVRFDCAKAIQTVNGRGYWPIGDALPNGS